MDEEGKRFLINLDDLPADWRIEQTGTSTPQPLVDVRDEIEARLTAPLHSLPLTELCSASTRVVIVCDELPTSGVRSLLFQGVLAHLERATVDPERVTLLIAALADEEAALHRREPPPAISSHGYASRIHVVQHDPNDVRELDDMGNFEGVPLTINYRAAEADLLIAISVMQLEDDSSDAGSCATITLGIVGRATRRELHTTRFYDDRVEPVAYARPLFERVVREGARRAGLVFAVDALVDADGRVLAVRAGAPTAVNDALADLAIEMREADVSSSAYDVVLAAAGVGGRTQVRSSLFDASRAAINLSLSRHPVLMRGGALILPVVRPEDDSTSARSFYDALTNASTPEQVIQQLQGRSLLAGEARAYLLAHAMQRHRMIAAGPQREQLARDSHFLSSPDVREAAELAENFVGKKPHALVVQQALSTVPVFNRSFFGAHLSSDDGETDDRVTDLARFN